MKMLRSALEKWHQEIGTIYVDMENSYSVFVWDGRQYRHFEKRFENWKEFQPYKRLPVTAELLWHEEDTIPRDLPSLEIV